MRSFIFNSRADFKNVWFYSLLISSLSLISLEVSLRMIGVRHSHQHSLSLWAKQRQKLEQSLKSHKEISKKKRSSEKNTDTKEYTILGSSRALAGIKSSKLAKDLHVSVFQLSRLGQNMLPYLEEIAQSPTKNAPIVLLEITPMVFFRKSAPNGWFKDYKNTNIAQKTEAALSQILQANFVVTRPGFDFRNILAAFGRGHLPEDFHNAFSLQREFEMHLNKYPRKALKKHLKSEVKKAENCKELPNALKQEIEMRLALAIQIIKIKGGDVIFLRLPSSGAVYFNEERCYNAGHYINELGLKNRVKFFNFEDFANLKNMKVPDGTHIDASDRQELTLTLANWLKK